MFRSLLVPLDGSAAAEHTSNGIKPRSPVRGATEDRSCPRAVWDAYGEGGLYDAIVDRDLREEMQPYLDGVIQRLSEVTKVSLSSALLDGLVAGAINRHTIESGVDLVVMTTRGAAL